MLFLIAVSVLLTGYSVVYAVHCISRKNAPAVIGTFVLTLLGIGSGIAIYLLG